MLRSPERRWRKLLCGRRVGSARAGRISGSPLLDDNKGGPATIVEGTVRFVGEPLTGAVSRATGDVADGVTINLAGVPVPQAAKTVLGDISASNTRSIPASKGGPRFRRRGR
jgi:general secretion pathway protein D